MFFRSQKKDPDSSPASLRGWPDTDKKWQSVRISIEKVRLSLSGSWGGISFELEGSATVQALSGYLITATLEPLEPFETPGRLRDSWTTVPESVEGTCEVQEAGRPSDSPYFHATLFFRAKSLDSIQRTLQFVGGHGVSAVLDLEFDYPDITEPAFWADAWRTRELRVRSWRLIAESARDASPGA